MSVSRSKRRPRLAVPSAAYVLASLALLPVPVLGVLHVEASAVLAAVAFFVAAFASVRAINVGESLGRTLYGNLALALIPAVFLAVASFWRPNCDIVRGASLYALFVFPSVGLGVSLAFALTASRWRSPALWIVGFALVAIFGGVVSDLGFHPQLFTYNHVFGGVLGPIYDEELSMRPGLFVFRGLTLLWCCWLIALGKWLRTRSAAPARFGAALSVVIGLAYVFSVPLGFQQSESNLARKLGGVLAEGGMALHYDPVKTTAGEVRRAMDEALFRSARLDSALGVTPTEPVHIYLYPDRETKGALLGSRETSVVPVWLRTPQIHMLAESVERSLGHELVHVYARSFGMPLIHASPSIGLVEGLAVALEPPEGLPKPETLAAVLLEDSTALDFDPAEVVASTMRPLGFWTQRASLAYTVNGAFVSWLLERFGAGPMRIAYANADFRSAYGVPLDSLAVAWAEHLRSVPISDADRELASWLFGQPSLFEVRCPHFVPRYERDTRDAFVALETGAPERALDLFRRALADTPTYAPAVSGAVNATAALGLEVSVADARSFARRSLDSTSGLRAEVAVADLLTIAGASEDAAAYYKRALESLQPRDIIVRTLLRRRMAASRTAIRALSSSAADLPASVRVLEREDPFWNALLLDQSFEADSAWAHADDWCSTEQGEAQVALTYLKASLAYRAGETEAASRYAASAQVGFALADAPALAELSRDLFERSEWRIHRDGGPGVDRQSIFGTSDSRADALVPVCSDDRSAGRGPAGVRVFAGGGGTPAPATREPGY